MYGDLSLPQKPVFQYIPPIYLTLLYAPVASHFCYNAVAPGIIDTPMTDRAIGSAPNGAELKKIKGTVHPLGRLGLPLEVARTVLFLASEEASFITGAIMPVDGGYLAG